MTNLHDTYVHYLETLTPDTLPTLDRHVINDVHFKDPFNDVKGVDKMTAAFEHMFENLGTVEFKIHHAFSHDSICLMNWTFVSTLRKEPWKFDGTSKVTFAENGLVSEHIDYWDAAADFYEHLPLIGWPLRRIRRTIAIR